MKFCKEIVLELCGYLESGNTQEDAASLCGISEDTFYEWKKNKPEFSEALKKAQLKCKNRNIEVIKKASSTTWQAAAWWLERKHPDEYGQRQKLEHSGRVSLSGLVARLRSERGLGG